MSDYSDFTRDSFTTGETPAAAKWNELWANDESLADGKTWMTGGIIMWPAASAPTGWLICDGSSLSRATYAALFALIGTTYGAADGSHFSLPDLRSNVAVGLDSGISGLDALGDTGGEITGTTGSAGAHTHTVNSHSHSIPSQGDHTHIMTDTTFSNMTGLNGNEYLGETGYGHWMTGISGGGTDLMDVTAGNFTQAGGSHDHGGSTGSAGPGTDSQGSHTHSYDNMMPFIVLNYIIKY